MSHELNPSSPASKPGRFKTFVAWVCGPIVLLELIILLLAVAYAGGTHLNDNSERTYVSSSRLLIGGADMNPKMENGEPIPDSFFGTNVELMQSARVLQGAVSRLHALHPDLKPQPCRLTAGRLPGANIIVLQARGPEPDYVQAYLDAVIDEFIATRKELKANKSEGVIIAIGDELVRLEKEMPLAEQRIKAAEQSGASPETLIEPKAKLQQIKMQYDRLIGTLRQLDVRHSADDSFAILERASPPVRMVPQFFLFNVFK